MRSTVTVRAIVAALLGAGSALRTERGAGRSTISALTGSDRHGQPARRIGAEIFSRSKSCPASSFGPPVSAARFSCRISFPG